MRALNKRLFLVIFAVTGLIAPTTSTAYGQRSDTAGLGNAAAKLPQRALVQIGTDNLRTRGFITRLVFSPDGKQIACVDANAECASIILFNVTSGMPLKQLSAADAVRSRTSCVAFSPDGTKLLWGETDGHLAVWDLAGDRLVFREKLHAADVNDVVYSPRGNIVATCGAGGEVQLREANNLADPLRLISIGNPARAKVAGHMGGGRGECVLAFTPNGEQLVVASKDDGQIFVLGIADGALDVKVKFAHGTRDDPKLRHLAVTPDGRQIMTAGQRTVPRSQTKLKLVSKNVMLSQVYFWDLESGKRTSVLNGDEDYGRGYAALSPNGKTVAVADFSRLKFQDVGSNKLIRTISLPGWWGNQPAFSPDGALVAISIYNAVGLFEVATGRRLHHDDQTPIGSVQSAAWSSDCDRIVTGHDDGYVRSWDSQTGGLVWCRQLAPVISLSGSYSGPAFVGFTPDGKSIVVAGRRDEPVEFHDGIIAVLDAATGDPRRTIPLKEIRHGALSPDGQTIVAAVSHGAANDTRLFAFDLATGKSLFVTPPEEQRPGLWMLSAIQFRADSQELLLATGSEVFRLDAATGREKQKFVAENRTPEQIQAGKPSRPSLGPGAFSTDGKTLFSSSADWIYVWDIDTGTLRSQFGHPRSGLQTVPGARR